MQGFISVNKPKGMTSFAVVNRIKRTFNEKAGHCGTLDPNAEGVLIVAVGSATKALPYMGLESKVYEACLKFGITTDTGDVWGETIHEQPITPFTKEAVEAVLKGLLGKQSQRVPMVSAKKIKGKKLYEYHRQNIAVETQYTDIEIYDIELITTDEDSITFRAHVSNGTYIRTLCEDIAEALNNIGSMSALTRVRVGNFDIEDSIPLDLVDINTPLQSSKAVIDLPIIYNEALEFDIMNGKRIELESDYDIVLLDSGTYYAVYKREEKTVFRSVRGLW